ncbi:hypothetical protein, partial [Paraclostridium bifermentans]|uniref:hypothetical protein n=1 Tax=Paraclostridium bifermentans TaxID=1490 RepID=UPI002912609D|nr:Ig-like domain-containing protein [Paraclostridium bifermentans]
MKKLSKFITAAYIVNSITCNYVVAFAENDTIDNKENVVNNMDINDSNQSIKSGSLQNLNLDENEVRSDKEIKSDTNEKIENNKNQVDIKEKNLDDNEIQKKILDSRITIDGPRGTIDNKDIKVRGWALNPSGIKEVKVYVDGKYKSNAKIGLERTDVDVEYTGYPDGKNIGYELEINKRDITLGSHIIKVEAIGNDGSMKSSETQINMVKLDARMSIDEPKGTIDNKDIKVRGWALNPSGIKEVKVYVDGKYKSNAKTGLERTDVDVAYPGYSNGKNSGYELLINKSDITLGNHTIKVDAIGNDGSSKSSETQINMVKLDSRMSIDEPTGKIDNKDVKVRGWALNPSGIKEVKVYVDGKYKSNAKIGLERLDVDVAYPGYPDGKNSGYELLINKNDIAAGNHKIKVETVGNDGSINNNEVDISMNKPQNRIMIDDPRGTIDNKDIKVRGWALNSSGIKEVKVYVDGKYKSNA